MAAVAYIRVSTDKQDADNQRLEILRLANDKNLGQVRFIEEVVSGRKSWRNREIASVLDSLKAGDALVVAELSRLGRSMLEIMEILSIATQRSIRVYAAKGNWSLDGSLQSKVVAMAFSMAAEIERDLISQRTRSALATKQGLLNSDGFYISRSGRRVESLGRPRGPGKSRLDKYEEEIRGLLALGVPQRRIAGKYGTSPRNLWAWMRKRGIDRSGARPLH